MEDDWGKLLDGDISMSSYWKDGVALGEMVRWLEIVGCPVCGERDPVIRLIECSVGSNGYSCKVFCQRCGREFHVYELEKISNTGIREVTCPCCNQGQHEARLYWIQGEEYEGLMGRCRNCMRIFQTPIIERG
ncbi:MAG: hypothetical protein HZA12_00790 [Nitrospirae bacterium]|nr:hypothetical protein [Nitrospirota bacterium]